MLGGLWGQSIKSINADTGQFPVLLLYLDEYVTLGCLAQIFTLSIKLSNTRLMIGHLQRQQCGAGLRSKRPSCKKQ